MSALKQHWNAMDSRSDESDGDLDAEKVSTAGAGNAFDPMASVENGAGSPSPSQSLVSSKKPKQSRPIKKALKTEAREVARVKKEADGVKRKAVRDAARIERYAGYPVVGGGVYDPSKLQERKKAIRKSHALPAPANCGAQARAARLTALGFDWKFSRNYDLVERKEDGGEEEEQEEEQEEEEQEEQEQEQEEQHEEQQQEEEGDDEEAPTAPGAAVVRRLILPLAKLEPFLLRYPNILNGAPAYVKLNLLQIGRDRRGPHCAAILSFCYSARPFVVPIGILHIH